MNIKPNRMDYGFLKYQKEFEEKAIQVLRSGWYIMGEELKTFEQNFAAYTGAKYCVGLANGLDALWIGCKMLGIGPGDEVLVQGNTYIASVMGITMNGATPIFVEPDDFYQIDADRLEALITEKTKAIMVVHLYGQVAQMDKIVDICKKHNLKLIEDCAQSHGATFNGQMTGTFGDIGCFSFYPSKNLGAFGDGGALVTNSAEIAENTRVFRNYGSEKRYYNKVVGANSRLDEIQAGLLNVRLSHLEEITEERIKLAAVYDEAFKDLDVELPKARDNTRIVYHQYVLRTPRRDELIAYLNDKGVGTIIHYPIPPHLAECYKSLGHKAGDYPITESYANSVVSIPMYNGMTKEEQDYVIEAIRGFFA